MQEILSDLGLLAALSLGVTLSLVLVFLLGRSAQRWIGNRAKRSEVEARLTAEKAAQYAAHNERLEQRVRALERIVAGQDHSLTEQSGRPLN